MKQKKESSVFDVVHPTLIALTLGLLVFSIVILVKHKIAVKAKNNENVSLHNLSRFFYDLESKVKKWEFIAPECLQAHYMPIQQLPDGSINVSEPRFSFPTSRPYGLKKEIFIQGKVALANNQPIYICHANGIIKAKLSKAEAGDTQTRITLTDVEMPESKDPLDVTEIPNALVVAVTDTIYYSAVEADQSQILYQKTDTGTKSLLLGFSSIQLNNVVNSADDMSFDLIVTTRHKMSKNIKLNFLNLVLDKWYIRNDMIVRG